MKNNRSTGPDEVPNELLKNAGSEFIKTYTNIINKSFENGQKIDCLTIGDIIPIPKPGKEKGPVTSLRPITLLNSVRKILSLITLKRIEQKVNSFIGPTQHGYMEGVGCEDIIWAQKILTSLVLKKKWSYKKMGIDMSRAFDTIKRRKILTLLSEAGCTRDEVALVRYLLSNTLIKIKIEKERSISIETSLGSGQGDSLSGTLFTLYLAGAIKHLRQAIKQLEIPFTNEHMPLEMEYVDDCDFIGENIDDLKQMLPKIEEVFAEWNLTVNPTKTEYVDFTVSEDPKKRGTEEWRKCSTLGSLACSKKDIERRIILANTAYGKLKRVWKTKIIPDHLKLRIYDSLVISILMYNSGTWAVPSNVAEKLDTCHRKHLRDLLRVKWQDKIKNEKLYEMAKTFSITSRMGKARWRIIGKVLRLPIERPASLALKFAINKMQKLPSRRGRPTTNLFDMIDKDIKRKLNGLSLMTNFEEINEVASDPKRWSQLWDKKYKRHTYPRSNLQSYLF